MGGIGARVMRGHLGVLDGKAIGWCSAGPRIGHRSVGDGPEGVGRGAKGARVDGRNIDPDMARLRWNRARGPMEP